MVHLFLFGFIFIFGAGYVFAGAMALWSIATIVALLLNKIFGLFNFSFKKQKIETPVSVKSANLADPIGAMSIIAQRYNDFIFLKDIAFLEVQLFGRNSNEVVEQFLSAQADPRPEVCGASANKMLLHISRRRLQSVNQNQWTSEQEALWEKQTPKEWRLVVNGIRKTA